MSLYVGNSTVNSSITATTADLVANATVTVLSVNANGAGAKVSPTSRNNTSLQTLDGIGFPATAVSSNDSNVLDDYEEGTWTPTLLFGGTSTGMTYSTQLGTYTKIGQLVFIRGRIVLSAKGSSTGSATIGGLPFTSLNQTSNRSHIGCGLYTALGVLAGVVGGYINNNATTGVLNQGLSTTSSGISDTQFTNSSAISISAIYGA